MSKVLLFVTRLAEKLILEIPTARLMVKIFNQRHCRIALLKTLWPWQNDEWDQHHSETGFAAKIPESEGAGFCFTGVTKCQKLRKCFPQIPSTDFPVG